MFLGEEGSVFFMLLYVVVVMFRYETCKNQISDWNQYETYILGKARVG